MKTGFEKLDEFIDINNKLILIGGRNRTERTKLSLNIATNVALTQNIPTLIFSLKNSKEKLINNIISSESRIDWTSIESNKLTEDERTKIKNVQNSLNSSPLYINDKIEMNIEDIKQTARQMKEEKDIKLIVIDYLKLNNGNDFKTLSKEFGLMQKQLDLTIIILIKLSVDIIKRKDKRPYITDFKESLPLVYASDIVLLMYRDDCYNEDSEDKSILELTVAKNRDGDCIILKMVAIDPFCKFVDMAKPKHQMVLDKN